MAAPSAQARLDPGSEREFWTGIGEKGGAPFLAALDWVGLDAYPELTFDGSIDQISPIGQQSTLSPKVQATRMVTDYVEQWYAKAGEAVVDNDNGRSGRATEMRFDSEFGVETFTFFRDLVADGLAVNVGEVRMQELRQHGPHTGVPRVFNVVVLPAGTGTGAGSGSGSGSGRSSAPPRDRTGTCARAGPSRSSTSVRSRAAPSAGGWRRTSTTPTASSSPTTSPATNSTSSASAAARSRCAASAA